MRPVTLESQVCKPLRRLFLEDLRQFRGKSALGFVLALSSTATLRRPIADSRAVGAWFRWFGGACGRWALHSTLGGLRRVGPKNFIFERGSVEAANDRLHFVRCRSLDKRESFGFLRLVVPNHLNRIRDKIFCSEPLFDVVRSDPYG